MPLALGRRRGGARRAAGGRAHRRRDHGAPGVRPAGRRLDLLGLEGRLLLDRGRRPRLLRRDALHAGGADGARRTRPQWFNTGLHWAYGIDGPAQGHYYVDSDDGRAQPSRPPPTSTRSRTPASSSRSSDDLVNDGGIMDLWVREARLFKYGSGTGTNFSALRGENEPLSGGGKSSGLMSFLKIGDRAAGAIKSGGTTRRAAKMVIFDLDHPDIEEFINWKVVEEQKVAALVAGSKLLTASTSTRSSRPAAPGTARRPTLRPARQPGAARRRSARRRSATCPRTTSSACCSWPRRAYDRDRLRTYDTDWDTEAYLTVSGQNSNNSVRVTDDFMRRGRATDADWAADPPHRRQGRARRVQGRASSGSRSATPPGPAPTPASSSTHHQRLAHLPGRRADQRVEPVLGVHVPRRHGLQPRVAEPARRFLRRRRPVRRRGLRPRHPALDDRRSRSRC